MNNQLKEYITFITLFTIVPTSLTTFYAEPYLGIILSWILNSFVWANVCWIVNNKLKKGNKKFNED